MTGLKIIPPLLGVEDSLDVNDALRPARLLYLGKGHTDGDLVLYLPKEKIAFVGDLFFNSALPNTQDAFLLEWIRTLGELLKLDAETFVPGHGPVETGPGPGPALDGLLEHVRNGTRDARRKRPARLGLGLVEDVAGAPSAKAPPQPLLRLVERGPSDGRWELRRLQLPRGAVTEPDVWVGETRRFLKDQELRQIALFAFLYLTTLALGPGILAAYGYPLKESLFEFASALGTVGLCVGVTAADEPQGLLWAETAGMLLGRLEFFVIFLGVSKLLGDLGAMARAPAAKKG